MRTMHQTNGSVEISLYSQHTKYIDWFIVEVKTLDGSEEDLVLTFDKFSKARAEYNLLVEELF